MAISEPPFSVGVGEAPAAHDRPLRDGECVTLDADTLLIADLRVGGFVADAVRHAVATGHDPEDAVRQMLAIGGMVLQHGATSSIAEAVISELRRDAASDAKLQRLADRLPAKGFVYEAGLQPLLEQVFAPFCDVVEATGRTRGLDGDKGDFVVTLNPESIGQRDRRVVIEAKDKESQSVRGALTYLEDAMRNRQAEAGVLVTARPMKALGAHRLRVYPGNRILVRYDRDGDPLALEVACQLARALAARATGRENLGTDTAVLRQRVEQLRGVLDRAVEMRRGITEARRGVDRIDGAYDALRTEALALIEELDDRLSG